MTAKCSYSIGPHGDTVGPALGRQSVLQVYPPMAYVLTIRHQLAAIDVGICVIKCGILLTCLFTWQYTTWKYNYAVFHSFSVL